MKRHKCLCEQAAGMGNVKSTRLEELEYNLGRLEDTWYKKQQHEADEIRSIKEMCKDMKRYFNMGFMDIIRHKLLKWLDVFGL